MVRLAFDQLVSKERHYEDKALNVDLIYQRYGTTDGAYRHSHLLFLINKGHHWSFSSGYFRVGKMCVTIEGCCQLARL